MAITAILSLIWVRLVEHRIQDLANSYIPAHGHLARTNIRSLERALAMRCVLIEKIQIPSGGDKIAGLRGNNASCYQCDSRKSPSPDEGKYRFRLGRETL
jgi:hypothetical protein